MSVAVEGININIILLLYLVNVMMLVYVISLSSALISVNCHKYNFKYMSSTYVSACKKVHKSIVV